MIKKLILAALAVSTLGTAANAAPDWHRGHDRDRQVVLVDRGNHGDRQIERRPEYRSGYRPGRPVVVQHWQRGQRFDYRRAPRYAVINSPRAYRLYDAPRGYRWVRSGNDAVLIGITSGLIGAVLAGVLN